MEENKLIEKLKNTKVPEIQTPHHQQRLKSALLESGNTPNKSRISAINERIQTMIMNGLFSRQPVWKTALIGGTCITVAIVLGILIPPSTPDSVYASDGEIINEPNNIKVILGEYDKESTAEYNMVVLDLDEAFPYLIEFDGDSPSRDTDNKPDRIIITFPTAASIDKLPGETVIEDYDIIKLSTVITGESWEIYLVIDKEKLEKK